MLVSVPRDWFITVLLFTSVFVPSHWSVVSYFWKSFFFKFSSWNYSLIFQEFRTKLLKSWFARSLAKLSVRIVQFFPFPLLCLKSVKEGNISFFFFFFFQLFFSWLVPQNELDYQLKRIPFFKKIGVWGDGLGKKASGILKNLT